MTAALCGAALLLFLALGPIEVEAKPSPPKGCAQSYSRATFHTAARKVFRRFPYTAHEQRTLGRVIRCQAFPKSVEILRHHARRYRAGFAQRFYWRVRWSRVPGGLKARLSRLRSCESTNNPRASNGSHWGYYQYDMRTWGEAQSWAGVPATRHTGRADYASPIHQNVVTASFFPANTGRWACRA